MNRHERIDVAEKLVTAETPVRQINLDETANANIVDQVLAYLSEEGHTTSQSVVKLD
ncbi:MAG: hypothetical protein U0894_00725 [Pirellulales bacterium]